MSFKFVVYGEPRGKQRPRMCYVNGKTIVYTPKPTKEYERKIKKCYKAVSKSFFDKNVPVEVNVKAFFPILKSVSEKLKIKFMSGKVLPTKPPDLDNTAKIVCDALNGVAFFDDSQVCRLIVEKCYSLIPKIVVELKEMETE